MQAYLNDPKVKEFFIKRINDHIVADELIKGIGYEKNKGCFIGCLFNDYDHSLGPKDAGFPIWILHFWDLLHENMSPCYETTFAPMILETIKPGICLDDIKPDLMTYILSRNATIVRSLYINPVLKNKLLETLMLNLSLWLNDKSSKEENAENAAENAAESAANAAESAANAAWSAESAARSARSAAWSARSAAWSARSAAESAYWNAESAANAAANAAESAAESAAWSARSAKDTKTQFFEDLTEELIRLIRCL